MTMIASSTVSSDFKKKNHQKIFENTYLNNTNSDYTEKMEELARNFDYNADKEYYWGPPELSIFYGTPLYEQASSSQKLALNHLFWVGQYNHTAATEANTVLYNQVTSGVFSRLNSYETLCKELDLETNQEHTHIYTFQKIGYKIKLALLGKQGLKDPRENSSSKNSKKRVLLNAPAKTNGLSAYAAQYRDSAFRLITKLMQKDYEEHYSTFLKIQEERTKEIPGTSGGLGGLVSQGSLQKFFTINWGSSPFLATQYYAIRMIGNMSLKCYEYNYFKYFKTLQKREEFIPTPTAVSHYHLLDESFHTTFSQVISQNLYKDFPAATNYEKTVANLTVLMAQLGVVGGLSGVMPTVFRSDAYFQLMLLRILKSPIFSMSNEEALYWMEKCLCHEHDGFYQNQKYHRRLVTEFRRFFDPMQYLWPVNHEMKIMSAGGSIEKAIKTNKKSFKEFVQTFN